MILCTVAEIKVSGRGDGGSYDGVGSSCLLALWESGVHWLDWDISTMGYITSSSVASKFLLFITPPYKNLYESFTHKTIPTK